MIQTIKAAVIFKRPHVAKLYLEDGRLMVLRNSDVQSVLRYADWNDTGVLIQTNKGIKFIVDSELVEDTVDNSSGTEMIVYEPL